MNIIRIFNLLAFDFCEADYIDMIKWENVTESPLTERFNDDMTSEAIVIAEISSTAIISTIKVFPCHTQAVERIVKTVTKSISCCLLTI